MTQPSRSRWSNPLSEPNALVGPGAVLYDTRDPDRRPCCSRGGRCLAHVVGVYEETSTDEVYFRVQDGTHTTDHWCHQGDLLALYEPAGWSVDTAVKPTYALTRRHGVEDHHDLMTDGGSEVLWTHSVENDVYYRIDAWKRTGSGNVIPKCVEEVPEERVPAEHRRNTLGLNRGVLS